MRQFLKLNLIVLMFSVPFSVSASEQDLMKKSYTKLENILDFMEYGSAVEVECAQVNKGRAYKKWLMFNIKKLKVMTGIQKAYQMKAAEVGDLIAVDYFDTESNQRQKMVSKAVNIISTGSANMKQRLCAGLQDMVVVSEGRTQVDNDLNYLVRNQTRILGAISNNANW